MKAQQEKGHAIVALKVFIKTKGIAKVELGVAKGKKLYDKRATIKARDIERKIKSDY